MNREDKIKVLAELDGFMKCNGGWIWLMGSPCPDYRPDDYLTSHDAIIPLIQKQSRDTKEETGSRIVETLTESDTNILDATPEQLADALIKAVGKWKD